AELRARHMQIWRTEMRALDRAKLRGSRVYAAGWSIFAASYIAGMVLVASRAVNGQATAGDVLLGLTLAAGLSANVGQAVGFAKGLANYMHPVRRFAWLLEYADHASQRNGNATPPTRLEQGLELRDVTFTYPGTDTEILHAVDLKVPARTTLAIVGEN